MPLDASFLGSGGQQACMQASHLWGRADPKYVWNAHLCKPLIGEPFTRLVSGINTSLCLTDIHI